MSCKLEKGTIGALLCTIFEERYHRCCSQGQRECVRVKVDCQKTLCWCLSYHSVGMSQTRTIKTLDKVLERRELRLRRRSVPYLPLIQQTYSGLIDGLLNAESLAS